MKRLLLVILFAASLIGCIFQPSTPTPTPKPVVTAVPTAAAVVATTAPTQTALPPTVTAPAATAVPPSDTPAPTATGTPTPTRTRVPATRAPLTATPTVVVMKYPAPQLGGPGPGDLRVAGKDDLVLRWDPVADLGTNECYEVTVRITNLTDPARRYGQASYLAQETCNSSIAGGPLQFTLFVKRHGQPDYEGLLAIASQNTPSSTYQVRWWVNVASTDQKPLSPASKPLEFTLNSP